MLIVEHFFLIAIDPRAGVPSWPRRTQDAEQLAAAAVLLDLAEWRRLRLRNAQLLADTRVPLTHPLLVEAVHALAAHPLPAGDALELLMRRLHPLVEQVLEGLFRRDLMHRNVSRRWLKQRVRYPLRSVQARNEAVARLRRGTRDAADVHGLALQLLADFSGLLPELLDAREHELAMRRVLALDASVRDSEDAQAILAQVRAALLA